VDFDLFEDLAAQAVRTIHDFNAQALCNTAWAFATAGHAAPELFEALADQVVRQADELNPQGLSNLLWAFATVGHKAPTLFEVLAGKVARCIHELSPQNIVNIAWAFVTAGHKTENLLEANVHEPAINEISEDHELHPHVANALDALQIEARRRLNDFGLEFLLSLYWAYSFARLLSSEFEKEITEAAMRIGEIQDKAHESGEIVGANQGGVESTDQWWHIDVVSEVPQMLSEGTHWIAFYKPPHWIVDVNRQTGAMNSAATFQQDRDEDEVENDYESTPPDGLEWEPGRKLHMHHWIRQFAQHAFPILRDPAEAHGLVHRIDAETSGLLLCAKSYAGANWLRLQWHAHAVVKEYVCLVHGWVDRSVQHIHKRINVEKGRLEHHTKDYVTVGPNGKPSHTEIVAVAHLERPIEKKKKKALMEIDGFVSSGFQKLESDFETGPVDDAEQDRYSLVAVKLHTGRRHQIRAHLGAMGHSVVCDGKYDRDSLDADRKWCKRNFLHVYRLGFRDTEEQGGHSHISCPLPEDLRDALKVLKPVDQQSGNLLDIWLDE